MHPLFYLIPAELLVALVFIVQRQRARRAIMIPEFLRKPGEVPAGREEWIEVHFGKNANHPL